MSFFDPQNPGIGGLDELTDSELLLVQQIAGLGDPNADRILFWDDSASSYAFLSLGTGLSIAGTTISATGGVAWGSITGTLSAQTDLQSALDGKQPIDTDLTTIAGLTATTDNFIVSVASAWASRTPAQVRTTLGLVIGTNVQAYDADLTIWAGITPGANVGTALAIAVGSAGAFVTFNGALGTPSSGTLTNATGLPIAGLVASTSTAIGVGTVELGHASDTTLSRSAAGVLAVEGIVIPSISSTNTITNKRIEPRIVSAASYTTDTGTSLDVSTADIFVITAQAGALLFNAPSGTPVQGQALIIRIKDNGTARALTWNAVFRAMGTALPSTTVLSKTLYLGFFYNSTDTKWDLVASAQEA